MTAHDPNPYAAPTADIGPTGQALVLAEEVRGLIGKTSTLMILAACIEMGATVLDLLLGELSKVTVLTTTVFLVLPLFVLLAGVSLRKLAEPGDDLAALKTGLRNLFVVFLIKGGALLLLLAVSVLTTLLLFT